MEWQVKLSSPRRDARGNGFGRDDDDSTKSRPCRASQTHSVNMAAKHCAIALVLLAALHCALAVAAVKKSVRSDFLHF